jgi:REP element-mobilizing transposase RayT
MSQSLSSLWTHLVFSTKDRFLFLKQPGLKNDMRRYLASVLRSHDCETLIVGGTSDHVHALFDLSRRYSVATIVKEIKRTSSSIACCLLTQGVALGWNLETPSALVTVTNIENNEPSATSP